MSVVPSTLAGLPVRLEVPLAPSLPLRGTRATAEAWVEVHDEAALITLIREARAEKLAVRVLTPLTDALPPEGGLTGICVRLGAGFERIEDGTAGLRVGAGVPLAVVGLRSGFEALRGAPGVLADALAEGWIAPMVAQTRRFRSRSIEEVDGCVAFDAKCVFVGATLRPGSKPTWVPRAGQAFQPVKRRDLRALLGELGLAGLRLGGAGLAEDDPTVLTNRGEATPKQMRLLVQAVIERVHVARGIEVEERLTAPGRGGRL